MDKKLFRTAPVGVAVAVVVMALSTSCLKTRSQLKDDDRSDSIQAGAPTRVDDAKTQQYAMEEIKSELTRITGRLEDMERERKEDEANSQKVGREDLKKLEERVSEFEKAQAQIITELKRLDTGLSQVDQVDLFEKGKKQYKAGDLQESLKTLSHYLRAPNGKHADEAHFLKGEIYYELQDCRKAITEYTPFQEKFKSSKLAPKAIYRIGLCFETLGMKNDAKLFFQELIDHHPKSPEAKSAQKKLSSKASTRSKSRP